MTKAKDCFQAKKYWMPKKIKRGNKGGMRKHKRIIYSKRVWVNIYEQGFVMTGLFVLTFD